MGSRKENLKKSLGISEYPWSSDEEDNNTAQPVQEVRRQSDDSRPSVADMPGTSGGNGGNTSSNQGSGTQQTHPSSPGTARRQQANMDRALFWSIINNTPRPSSAGVSRSRPGDVPLTYVARPAAASPAHTMREMTRRHQRPTAAADIQRILALKRITRNMQSMDVRAKQMEQTWRRRHSNLVNSAPMDPTSLYTPSMAAAVAQAANSRNNCCSRHHLPRSSRPAGCTRNANPPDVLPVGESQPSSSGRYRSEARSALAVDGDTSPPAPEQHQYLNVDQSDEDVEAVLDAAPAAEQIDDNNAEEENNESPPHNESAGAISLEEEVMEVDASDEPEPAPAHVETDVAEPAANNEPSAVPTNSDANAETAQQSSFHGVKRKRETTDENAEPYSVQEFNQSLLRLLECPVCLEWMEPPISQCRRGHLVCSRCRTRLASCPVCRTTFSSVRNRAMEGVAEMLRYPCRHGCGREVRLRRRAPHEASCGARRYHCPAPPCARHPPLAHHELAHHFQCKHLPIVKIGRKHKFSMKVNSEQHDTWLIMAMDEYFHLRVDVDIRTWGVIVYVAYIGPKRKAKHYTYEVTVEGHHNCRSLKYSRATHSDLESSSLNVSRQDCFHLTLDQALNFLRFKNRHCEPDKFLDFDVEIGKCQTSNAQESKDESDS